MAPVISVLIITKLVINYLKRLAYTFPIITKKKERNMGCKKKLIKKSRELEIRQQMKLMLMISYTL